MTKEQMKRIRTLIREGLEEAEERWGRVDLDVFQKDFEEQYRDELDDLAYSLARRQLHSEIKRVAQAVFGDEEIERSEANQLSLLPGNVQRFYSVEKEGGGYLYVAAMAMTMEERNTHLRILYDNRMKADARIQEFELQSDALRPYMPEGSGLTMRDALAAMARR